METQMQMAFEQNGLKISKRRLLWNWIKDHPDHTEKEIATAVKVKTNGQLHELVRAGYLMREKRTRLGHMRTVFRVTGPEYKAVPQAKAPKPQAKPPEVIITAQNPLDTIFGMCMRLSVGDFIKLRARLNGALEE